MWPANSTFYLTSTWFHLFQHLSAFKLEEVVLNEKIWRSLLDDFSEETPDLCVLQLEQCDLGNEEDYHLLALHLFQDIALHYSSCLTSHHLLTERFFDSLGTRDSSNLTTLILDCVDIADIDTKLCARALNKIKNLYIWGK